MSGHWSLPQPPDDVPGTWRRETLLGAHRCENHPAPLCHEGGTETEEVGQRGPAVYSTRGKQKSLSTIYAVRIKGNQTLLIIILAHEIYCLLVKLVCMCQR